MHLIYEALKKTGGRTEGEALIAAAKGMAWKARAAHVDRPRDARRGATVYVRRVERSAASSSTSSSTRSRTQGPGEGADEELTAASGGRWAGAWESEPVLRAAAHGCPSVATCAIAEAEFAWGAW